MIRKPPAGWQREEGAPVRAVRTVIEAASDGRRVMRRGGHLARGALCFFFAIMWGFVALTGGLFGSPETFFGVGAMAAFMVWAGRRAFAKASETSD